MRNLSVAVRTVLFLVVAGGVGLFIGWLVSRQDESKLPISLPSSNAPTVAIQATPAPAIEQPAPVATAAPQETVAQSPPAEAVTSTNWEEDLEHILLANEDEAAKADHILALIPTAPPEAQVELSQHLVNMVEDDHYGDAAVLLTNSTTPAAVSTVLMNDLLNRNNTIKLPTLLEVARSDDHPLKDQAREMLELLLQENHGTNWEDWSTSINTWLAQNQ